jgi:hypothetical protein
MAFKDFNEYEKNYVILTSDRLVFNSKDDSIFLTSKKSIGLSAIDTVNIDVGISGKQDPNKNAFVVNSPNIQFGLPKFGVNEHVAKAESSVGFISELLGALGVFSSKIVKAQALGIGTSAIPAIFDAATYLKAEVDRIKIKYAGKDSPIISKITKTI